MSEILHGYPELEQAYGKYLQFNSDEKLRALDEAHQRFLHDLATDIEAAHDKGVDEGETKKGVEVARNMIKEGFNTDVISRMTGLSPDEIEYLES